MSEKKFLDALREQSRTECQSILDEAEKEARRLLSAAQQQAKLIQQQRAQESQEKIEAEKRLVQNRTDLELKRNLIQAKGCALKKVKDYVWKDLENWIEKPLYEDALKEILLESAKAVGIDSSSSVKVIATSRDKRRLQGLLKKHNITYDLEIDESIQGGLLMLSADGRFLGDGRIETRLDTLWKESLPHLSNLLFEERPGEEEEENQKAPGEPEEPLEQKPSEQTEATSIE